MQEMNELKNLVIQTLESQGVLSQLRAQIRSSVFRVIENQEKSTKGSNNFSWENPLCQKIYESEEGHIALELMYELLEFYKFDYTLNVFIHEANIKETSQRAALAQKIKLKNNDSSKPLLMCLIQDVVKDGGSKLSGKENAVPQPTKPSDKIVNEISNAGPAGRGTNLQLNQEKKSEPAEQKRPNTTTTTNPTVSASINATVSQKKDAIPDMFSSSGQDKSKSLNLPNTAQQQQPSAKTNVTQQPQNAPAPVQDSKKKDLIPPQKEVQPQNNFDKKGAPGFSFPVGGNMNKNIHSKSEPDYDEQFEEELMEEDLPDEYSNMQDANYKKQQGFTSSEEVVMSQSQGLDMSVDSMVLEEYDYYEEAEKP